MTWPMPESPALTDAQREELLARLAQHRAKPEQPDVKPGVTTTQLLAQLRA